MIPSQEVLFASHLPYLYTTVVMGYQNQEQSMNPGSLQDPRLPQELQVFAQSLTHITVELTTVESTRDTRHLSHPNYPAAYIKASDMELWDTGEDNLLDAQVSAYLNLREAGVNVVPFAVVPTTDTLYAVTQKVEGVPAGQIIDREPAAASKLDTAITAALNYISSNRGEDKPLPRDIFGPHQ